jgi:CDP-4-dehydro-6-deoxyglucose reductase, E1
MIKLIKSTFYKEKQTKQSLNKFIEQAEQLSFGPQCNQFEANFAKWQGQKDCVFVNSGSSANLCLIQSLLNLKRLKKNDMVGFSAVTWSTNVMPLIQLGLRPIPIDVELDTLNVSSEKLLEILKRYKLKALFLTDLLGFCDDIDRIAKICRENNIILLEDVCESLGTIYQGEKLGNFGLASTFSFYVGHHMSTIEGGAICTNDEELLTMLRIVRAHGWDRNLDFSKKKELIEKYHISSEFYSRYTFYDLGFNLRPTEINGFLGNTQLQYLDQIIKKRERNFHKLALEKNYNQDKYYYQKYDHMDLVSDFAFPLVCKSEKIRDDLVEKCKDKIEIRPIVGGNMQEQPFYKKYFKAIPTPNSDLIHQQGLYIGNNPDLTAKEIKEIINILTV